MTENDQREIVLATIANSSLPAIDSEKLQAEVLNGSLWPVITLPVELATTDSPPEPLQPIQAISPDVQPQSAVADAVNVSPSQYSRLRTVDEATSHSVVAWVKGFLSDMGLGFGWAAFYFTVFTARFDGQTLGKKMLGIRVIQLDGANISFWAAFGRYGGYAAGFTTGLLGFMQIFWDANRQGIQDKISSTVVIDLVQMHKKQRLEQQAQGQNELAPVLTSDDASSAHLTTSTRLEHL